ncbi:hypothetical protein Tco_0383467 [Tanacetum coccineum]
MGLVRRDPESTLDMGITYSGDEIRLRLYKGALGLLHAHTRQLMDTEARDVREAEGRAMEPIIFSHRRCAISTHHSVHAQMARSQKFYNQRPKEAESDVRIVGDDRRAGRDERFQRAADRTRQQQIFRPYCCTGHYRGNDSIQDLSPPCRSRLTALQGTGDDIARVRVYCLYKDSRDPLGTCTTGAARDLEAVLN